MKKVLMSVCLLLSLNQEGSAQLAGDVSIATAPLDKPPPAQMFQLTAEQYNNHFDFRLPNDGRLLVDFLRLSDWGEKNRLKEITDIAAAQARFLKDSFSSAYSTKLLEINVPIDGAIIAFNYGEDLGGKKQMAYKEGNYYQLKTSFDTIRVVKNVRIREKPLVDSGLVQVQYTFILKDLSDIIALSEDPNVMDRIGSLADQEINKQRKRWPRQDASHHTFMLTYDPGAKVPMTSSNDDGTAMSFIGKRIRLFLGLGATVYTGNAISPFLDESLVYMLPSRSKMQRFVGFNFTGFGFFNSDAEKKGYVSYNLEYGLCKQKPYGFLQQKTSVVLGVMLANYKDHNKAMFNMAFNFGFNSFLSSGFGVASDFKKDSKDALIYINFKFNL